VDVVESMLGADGEYGYQFEPSSVCPPDRDFIRSTVL
jgi:hypothetical protein